MAQYNAYGVLQWYDYVIIALMLFVSMGIGIYFALTKGRRNNTVKEYLMAGRSLTFLPVMFSTMMSTLSALSLMGNTAESYEFGMVSYPRVIMDSAFQTVSAFIWVPFFYSLGCTTVFEYLEVRFESKTVRILGTLFFVVQQMLYAGLALFAPAVAVYTVTGLPTWISILAAGLVVTIYTTIGGFRSVVWTDAFQGLVVTAGTLTILIAGTIKAGGVSVVWNTAKDTGRLNFFEWSPDPYLRTSTWVQLFDSLTLNLVTMADQRIFQRYAAAKSVNQAIGSIATSAVMLIVVYTITFSIGLVAFAQFYALGCDPLHTDEIRSTNEVFTCFHRYLAFWTNAPLATHMLLYYIVNFLPYPAFPGLILAVLYSGAISSISSAINSMSATVWQDILAVKLDHLTETRKAVLNKCLALLIGLLCTGLSFIYYNFTGNFMQISFSLLGGVSAPMMGLFWLTLFPCVNWVGACCASVLTFVAMVALITLSNQNNPYISGLETSTQNCSLYNLTVNNPPDGNNDDIFGLFKLSFNLYPPLGMCLCVFLGLVISVATNKCVPAKKDPKYILAFFERICCCLPDRLLRFCWCGVPRDQAEEYDAVAPERKLSQSSNDTPGKTNFVCDSSSADAAEAQPPEMTVLQEESPPTAPRPEEDCSATTRL